MTRPEIVEAYGERLKEIELEHDLDWYKAQQLSEGERIDAESKAHEARQSAENRAANDFKDAIVESYLDEI